MPKVSIAIPTYNRAEYLDECLRSIEKQSFQDFVVYIFDNCSEYDLASLLKQYSHLKIILIGSDKNMGNHWNFQRIFGYDFPTEYVIIFHDDDTMHPGLLESEVVVMDKK